MYKSKNKNGITLIALIITIIILLILAGVTINIIIENGLFNTAKGAGEKYEQAYAREKLLSVLIELQADKITKIEYNEKEYIDNKLKTNNMQVEGNIVIVDEWQFEIDREKLIIIEEYGKIDIDNIRENLKLDSLTIELEPMKTSIKVSVTSINGQNYYVDMGIVEYRFSKDNGTTWTEYQTASSYTFNDLYGDLAGETYTVTVEAKDKNGNTKQISQTATTNCLFETYYRETADELLLTAGGREFYKTNSEGAATGLAVIRGSQDWFRIVIVSTNASAVEFYTTYSNTSLPASGSLEYYGITYYYSSTGESMPASSSYQTTVPMLNDTTNIYSSMEEAARALLDRYFLETSLKNTANEILCTIGGRTYSKTNNEEAIIALAYWNKWLGPVLVSTNSSAVEYYSSYSNSNITSLGSIQYDGKTYYYSNALEHMPASDTYSTTLPILNTTSNAYYDIEEAALNLLKQFYGK